MEVFGNEVTYTLKKNVDYLVRIQDLSSTIPIPPSTMTSDAKGVLVIMLPGDPSIDASFLITIQDMTSGSVVLIEGVDVVRQYASTSAILAYMQGKVNPTQAVEYERLARYMINAVVGGTFSQKIKSVEAIGNNTDALVLNDRIIAITEVYENNVLLSDVTEQFVVTASPYVLVRKTWTDGTQTTLVEENRLEHHPTWPTRYSLPAFKYEYDYVINGLFGWPVVPQDIQDATLLLINDIACGNNRYTNKYIRQWNGGGVAMSFADQVFAGTGNLIVDNILEKYKMEAIRARML